MRRHPATAHAAISLASNTFTYLATIFGYEFADDDEVYFSSRTKDAAVTTIPPEASEGQKHYVVNANSPNNTHPLSET
jgi:hypothetical protein